MSNETKTFTTCTGIIENGRCNKCFQPAQTSSNQCGRMIEISNKTKVCPTCGKVEAGFCSNSWHKGNETKESIEDRPLREHFEVETGLGDTLRTFDYIDALEKYCNSIESENEQLKAEIERLKGERFYELENTTRPT